MVDAETIANSKTDLQVEKIRNFQVRTDDIFVVTYPKSGTTWMKEIVPLVLNGGDTEIIKGTPSDVRVPYLDFVLSSDPELQRLVVGFGLPEGFDLNTTESPRVMASHLHAKYLPKQIEEKKPKVIYVTRNPKDVAVSCFHFVQKELPVVNEKPYESFSTFLTDFVKAKNGTQTVLYDGTLWKDHVLHWWNRRHESNVLFLTYENMKRDLAGNVRKIASFLEAKLDDDAVDRIAHHCCFESMKNNPMALKSKYCSNVLKVDPGKSSPFVRKGKVGGWKEYFTVADNEHFNELYKEWTKDCDIDLQFELS
ncbi:sulfotransferase 1C4-like [Saccoglossus kowalevskii]|uniref:Sulfotransferase 1C4-like n=1 Tax=Saccoglossus kowalevskii TaxID=10224 RepID=A0ABM0GWU9_SACKO|nr:PREDICTED: sulfotransferase 1C4-like [Saccoglossus kowalevskii]